MEIIIKPSSANQPPRRSESETKFDLKDGQESSQSEVRKTWTSADESFAQLQRWKIKDYSRATKRPARIGERGALRFG